ncbi:MAG: isoprenylcysteine carboxylmethyltransferase family protein [Candidatus Omnitrophota bacterium]|jgi:protein-S-isoprenylcysteine O-methyltransferase Ste14
MKKRLKINGLVMFLATIFLASFPAVFLRKDITGSSDNIAEVLGIALILLGQLIRVSARGFKAEHSKNGNVLIKGGPYSLVRNPMYLGIFLIGLGVVLMLFKWWVVAIFIVFFIIRYILLIYQEEKKLKSLFPESYSVYCKEVPRRICPSINALLERDICEYIPLKLKWIKKEIGAIIIVLFLVLLVESWEGIKYGGIKEYLKELTGISAVIFLFICLTGYLSWCTFNQNDSNKK